jgi:hypothetical protein
MIASIVIRLLMAAVTLQAPTFEMHIKDTCLPMRCNNTIPTTPPPSAGTARPRRDGVGRFACRRPGRRWCGRALTRGGRHGPRVGVWSALTRERLR